MNKADYLHQLNQALSGLTDTEKDTAFLFCKEMLDDRMESGMTEEEAVAAMEPADVLAQKLIAEIRQPATAAPAPVDGPAPGGNQWQKMQLTCDAASLNHIDLRAGNMGIKIIPSHNNQVTLTYFTRAQNVYEARVEGDTLILQEIKSENNRFFNFFMHFGGPRAEIILEVPRDLMASLKAFTKNGGIALKGSQMLTHVELGTTNGGITVEDVTCISVDAHTTNGGIALSRVVTKQDFSFHTTNGGVAAKDCLSGGDLFLKTTNGGIAAHNLQAEKALTVSSTNGGVKVSGLDAASIRLHTSNSPITGTVKGPQSLWQIDSHTTNGRNSLPAYQDGQKPLSVRTTNSHIQLSFE